MSYNIVKITKQQAECVFQNKKKILQKRSSLPQQRKCSDFRIGSLNEVAENLPRTYADSKFLDRCVPTYVDGPSSGCQVEPGEQ
jgi:hypothetical protein